MTEAAIANKQILTPPSSAAIKRVKVDDKRIINCRADLNQLVPIKYKWAWEKYLSAPVDSNRRGN